ncbi:MAG TPA: CAP domain-containing protein [Candidatus Angelobacter sp.]|nr:CAP domain-containing protein [Candidatus Angelobacter sp.]
MLRITRHLLPVIAAALLATSTAVVLPVEPTQARDGSTFVSLVNGYRAQHGVGPVSLQTAIDRIAIERADRMAADDDMKHDMTHVTKRLGELGVCWERVGEIIAMNMVASVQDRLEKFVEQWYTSTKGHRELMLNSVYTHAGGSWATGSSGKHYAAMVFVKLCGASTPPPSSSTSGTFTDIGSSKFRDDILWIANEGITTGCTETTYCPKGLVARDQMATFLRRAMSLGGASKAYFSDIWGNKHFESINSAREAGLTTGCGGSKYCPSGRVTRGQMASFLARALNLPPASRDYFTDDAGSVHEDAINRVAAARITFGCDTNRYCPGGLVNREQMAAFLRRAFE